MTKKNNSKELAFRLEEGIHDDLGPQINKLRFVQQLAQGVGAVFANLEGKEVVGLAAILYEVIESYDRVERLIPAPSPA